MNLSNDAKGCDYTGYEFGGGYVDSTCIDGWLWDMDSCDEPGGALSVGGDIPCPKCNHAAWLEHVKDGVIEAGYGAADDGDSKSSCPYPQNARFPEDGEILKKWWLKGFSDFHAEKITSPPPPTDDDLNAIARADLKRFRRAQKRLRNAARAGDVVGITLP